MPILRTAGVLLFAAAGAALLAGAFGNARDRAAAQAVWAALDRAGGSRGAVYDPSMTDGLPEVAQRYFATAIAPGTPLATGVSFTMEGVFVLNGRDLPMRAEQVLVPPLGFVWRAEVGSGLMRFSGSDGYIAQPGRTRESWTRFRLFGLVPLVRAGGSDDHARAAAARLAMETVWSPASLLPQSGAVWTQTGPDSAEVRFPAIPEVEPVHLRIDAQGRVTEVVTRRWTDANPEGVWRHQPFGGRMTAHERHGGFLVPVAMEVGNHHGTPDYAPFFRATLTGLRFHD